MRGRVAGTRGDIGLRRRIAGSGSGSGASASASAGVHDEVEAGAAAGTASRSGASTRESTGTTSTTSPGQDSPAQAAPEDRFSLEPIRRSVARAQMSREEFSALGDDGSDS